MSKIKLTWTKTYSNLKKVVFYSADIFFFFARRCYSINWRYFLLSPPKDYENILTLSTYYFFFLVSVTLLTLFSLVWIIQSVIIYICIFTFLLHRSKHSLEPFLKCWHWMKNVKVSNISNIYNEKSKNSIAIWNQRVT